MVALRVQVVGPKMKMGHLNPHALRFRASLRGGVPAGNHLPYLINHPPITAADIPTVIIPAKSGNGEAKLHALGSMKRMIILVAAALRDDHVPFADLLEEGVAGVLHALKKYNHDYGVRFSTYASYWIYQSMVRSLQNGEDTIRRPEYMHQRIRLIGRIFREINGEHDANSPTDAQIKTIAQITDLSENQVRVALAAKRVGNPVSLDQPVGRHRDEGDELPLLDLIPDPDAVSPFAAVANRMREQHVAEAMSYLFPREAAVLWAQVDTSLQSAADSYELTYERVRQVAADASPRLKQILEWLDDPEKCALLRRTRGELEFVLRKVGRKYGYGVALDIPEGKKTPPILRFANGERNGSLPSKLRPLIHSYFSIVRDVGLPNLPFPRMLTIYHRRRERFRSAAERAEKKLEGQRSLRVDDIVKETGYAQVAYHEALRKDRGLRRMMRNVVELSKIHWRRSQVARAIEKVRARQELKPSDPLPVGEIFRELGVGETTFINWREEDEQLLPQDARLVAAPAQGYERQRIVMANLEAVRRDIHSGVLTRPEDLSELAVRMTIGLRRLQLWIKEIPGFKEQVAALLQRKSYRAQIPKEDRGPRIAAALKELSAGRDLAKNPLRTIELSQKVGIAKPTFLEWVVDSPAVIPPDAIIFFSNWRDHMEIVNEHRRRRVRFGLEHALAAGVRGIGVSTWAREWMDVSGTIPKLWVKDDPYGMADVYCDAKYRGVIDQKSLGTLLGRGADQLAA